MVEKFTRPNFAKQNLGGLTKNLIPISIVIAALLIGGAIIYINQGKGGGKISGLLPPQQAAEKAINYINQNKETLTGGNTVSLLEVVEEGTVYKISLKIGENEFDSYVTKDGKLLFVQAIDLEAKPQEKVQEEESTIGNFSVSKDEICKENEKPIIYFFGSKDCPHCKWEHPIIEKVAKNFEGYISFHNNMDSDADQDVFSKYSTGGIPTLVLGCKYYRVGSGETMGEEQESKVLTALICKLTKNQRADLCETVQDLISQIK